MSEEPIGGVLLYRRDDGSPALEVLLEGRDVVAEPAADRELFQTSCADATKPHMELTSFVGTRVRKPM